LKRLLLLGWVVLLPSYSYSESITPFFGTTPNAAANGLSWDMGNVLPEPPGLDINGVIYSYTIQKQVEDSVTVNVQNENALGTGYIFRETDEWKPGSLGGTGINKVVPVIPNIPRAAWGDGSIEVDGPGSVTDPTVVYTYRVDPCFDPQFDPNCPGFKQPVPDIPEPEIIDVTEIYNAADDTIDLERETCSEASISTDCKAREENEEKEKSEEELEEEEEEEKKDRKERLEKALAEADNSAMFAQALAQSQILANVNASTNISSYYSTSIPGGNYKETVVLSDKQMPENKSGLRNGLAQQLLHNQMVDMQYK